MSTCTCAPKIKDPSNIKHFFSIFNFKPSFYKFFQPDSEDVKTSNINININNKYTFPIPSRHSIHMFIVKTDGINSLNIEKFIKKLL